MIPFVGSSENENSKKVGPSDHRKILFQADSGLSNEQKNMR